VHGIDRDTVIDGRYRVINRLGSGGMADVYCAEDTQLGRKVAVKLLYRRFAEDSEFVERFRREASSAAGLQHPNIVGVFDRGEWDGTYYIAMEYLKGHTLKQLVREHGAMPPDLAVDITIQVLRAAKFAHKRGVVHRDIKPHNVILDEEGRAKVTDFGIARAGASDMTETGSIMGTAQYLSPEQAQGQPVSPRSDLYSIGVMLYELLTGRVPFDAESPVTIALKHVSEPPVPPSELNPAIPPALEAVVLRALEKEPSRRFADADEFAAALLEARAQPTVVSKEMRLEPYPMPGEPFEEAVERDRRPWLWLLALLLLAALAVGAYLLLQPTGKPVPDVVGNRSAVASQRLQNAGFEVNIETVQSADVPNDRVATQDPQPGDEADEGSTVTIIVSSGPGQATVPGVLGKKEAEAERLMKEAGFETDVRRETSDTVGKGRVISTSPEENSQLEKGRTVVLVVSQGREKVSVPDVVGKKESEARSTLEGAGLRAEVTEEESKDEDPGTVLHQDPDSGEVDKGSAVKLVVAKAPPDVDVPDVVDQERDAARQALRDAGFEVRVREETVDTIDQDGIVIDQDPAGGEKLKKGSRVTIVVGKFEPPLNPEPTPTPEATTTPAPTP
jgi:beta-lactam-binding protein with PASTA domain